MFSAWLLLYAGWLLSGLSRPCYFRQLCPEWPLSAKRQRRIRVVGFSLLLCSYLVLGKSVGWGLAGVWWLGGSTVIITLIALLWISCSRRLMGIVTGVLLALLCAALLIDLSR